MSRQVFEPGLTKVCIPCIMSAYTVCLRDNPTTIRSYQAKFCCLDIQIWLVLLHLRERILDHRILAIQSSFLPAACALSSCFIQSGVGQILEVTLRILLLDAHDVCQKLLSQTVLLLRLFCCADGMLILTHCSACRYSCIIS